MKRILSVVIVVACIPTMACGGVLSSDYLRPINGVATNEYDSTRRALYSYNGAGLNAAGQHTNSVGGTMWMTVSTDANVATQSITYDLGAPLYLNGLHLWNHNQAGYTNRGIRDAAISYSLDGSTFSTPQAMTFLQADNSPTDSGAAYALPEPVVARYVKITSLHTFGPDNNYIGLAEVRFTTPNEITGVTATATSAYDGIRTPTKTVDSSGMSGFGLERADTNASAMWMTAYNHVAGESITFDLQDVHQLGAARIWNYNQFAGSTSYSRRGINTFDIEVSADNVTWDTLAGPLAGGHFQLTQATGQADFLEADMIDLGGVWARYVRFTVIDNFNMSDPYVGLSEVRFYQTAPEPSVVAMLLGLAGTALVAFRRRRGRPTT